MIRSIIKSGIISLVFLAGCCVGGSPTPTVQYPIIQVPLSPSLYVVSSDDLRPLDDETIRKLVENDTRLKNYIDKLLAAIEAYNNWARNNH